MYPLLSRELQKPHSSTNATSITNMYKSAIQKNLIPIYTNFLKLETYVVGILKMNIFEFRLCQTIFEELG